MTQRIGTNLGGGSHWADWHFTTATGPFATVRACHACKHTEIIRKGIPGVGRGYGFREGNKARGRMIQHIKSKHPELQEQ